MASSRSLRFTYHTAAPLAGKTRLLGAPPNTEGPPGTDAPLAEAHCEDDDFAAALLRRHGWVLFEAGGSSSSSSRTILSRIRTDGRLRIGLMEGVPRKKDCGTCAPPPWRAAAARPFGISQPAVPGALAGALVAKEKTSRRVPSARLPPAVPLHLELTCSLVQNAKNNGVLGPFLPPVSLQPFAAPS